MKLNVFTLYHLTAVYWTPGSDTAVHWRTQSEPEVDTVSKAIDVQVKGVTPVEHQSPDIRVHTGFKLGCTEETTTEMRITSELVCTNTM